MTLHLVNALANEDTERPLVHLLGRPYVSRGTSSCAVGEGSSRLLAFLAVNRGDKERRYVWGRLWPDAEEERGAGNLRSAIWRLNGLGPNLVHSDKHTVRLHDAVEVDVELIGAWANRLITGMHRPEDLTIMPWDLDQLDMLPGWYDDWVLLERERLRQRLLHAMECLSRELLRLGRYAEAVESALVAVGSDPLRESAQRVLIEAHLAEGNRCEALRRFEEHRALVRRELGVDPSPALATLVALRRPAVSAPSPLHAAV
ncbi:AfsR/SARP family transcriptional regulator [Georgenia subflava]|uniref:SARP family transcriptional regulator n=1 Tax=Georgenia subflava TaxID=1622177 RepID=A0A6N7EG01_9MICO|nr:BTAD domain-containing putative transcriptional regulator [Georgenia subflava]MPV36321.1 SARP family transcriptional regulator [Georgenia subflava]